MTKVEKYAAQSLAGCRFQYGSWNKRFARDLSSMASNDAPVTEKQVHNLWRLVHRYRRQIRDNKLTRLAERKMSESTGRLMAVCRPLDGRKKGKDDPAAGDMIIPANNQIQLFEREEICR